MLNFYPRSPCGERPYILTIIICIASFLSTLSLRRATSYNAYLEESESISIHALLAESDRLKPRQTRTDTNFYPRSPCGERLVNTVKFTDSMLFLSTLSLRRATAKLYYIVCPFLYFYPRSPCGERQTIKFKLDFINQISIHALLAESDARRPGQTAKANRFLSTLSLRRATVGCT